MRTISTLHLRIVFFLIISSSFVTNGGGNIIPNQSTPSGCWPWGDGKTLCGPWMDLCVGSASSASKNKCNKTLGNGNGPCPSSTQHLRLRSDDPRFFKYLIEGTGYNPKEGKVDGSIINYLKNTVWNFFPIKINSSSNHNASLSIYNSNRFSGPKKNSALSANWTFSTVYYLMKNKDSNKIIFCTPSGLDWVFQKEENGDYRNIRDGDFILKKSDNGYIIEGLSGIRYTFTDFVINESTRSFAYSTEIKWDSSTPAISFAYDDNHKLTSIFKGKDELLFTFNYSGDRIDSVYDADGTLLVTFKYNDLNRLVEINYGKYAGQDNYKYNFEYGDGGELIKKIRPNGGVITYEFQGGFFVKSVDARGFEITATQEGTLLLFRDKLGNLLKYTIDPVSGEYTKLEFSNGEVIERKLNAKGQIIEEIGGCSSCDGGGADSIKNIYNDKGRLIEKQYISKGEVEATEKYEYNTRGQVIAKTSKNGLTAMYKYDRFENVIQTTYPDGTTTKNEYNADGQLIKSINKLGHVTKTSYNDNGEVKRVTYPDKSFTENFYNKYGQFEGVIDRRGMVTYFKYDKLGRLITQAGPVGDYNGDNSVDLDDAKALYDSSNYLAQLQDIKGNALNTRDRNGNVTTHEYDLQWMLLKSTYPDGSYIEYTRDGNGNEVKLRNRDGTYKFAEYNVRGRIVKRIADDGSVMGEIDPQDTFIEYIYNADNQLIAKIDRMGNRQEYERDYFNHTEKEIDALGQVTIRENNISGRLSKYIDIAGNVTTYDYDKSGRLSKQTAPDGAVTQYEYDKIGRLIRTTGADGLVSESVYDKGGRVVKQIIDAEGQKLTTAYKYSRQGMLQEVIKDEGYANLTTKYEYDVFGRISKVTSPEGIVSYREYDNNGNVVLNGTKADGKSIVTRTKYDNMNRAINTIAPSGVEQLKLFNELGQLKEASIISENNVIFKAGYNYDEKTGRLQATIANPGTPDEAVTERLYDANGNVIAITDPMGATTRVEYDVLGRQTGVIDPLGDRRKTEYGKKNERVASIDQNGRQTVAKYDMMGRLTEQLNEMGQPVKYSYDMAGNRLTLQDANGNVSRWDYDSLGRAISLAYPNGDKESYTYDRLGRVLTKTTPDGATMSFAYDKGGRVTRIDTVAGALEFKYDALGRTVEEIDHTLPNGEVGRVSYKYNDLGQLVEKMDHNLKQAVKYTYNAIGQKISMIKARAAPGGINANKKMPAEALRMTVTYEYNINGLLSEIKRDGEKESTKYSYDKAGRRTKIVMPNGVSTDYTYDKAGRLLAVISRSKAGDIISGTEYTLDKTGNRVAMKLTLDGKVTNIKYTFDEAYRLTGEYRTNEKGEAIFNEEFTYDALGNRIKSVRVDVANIMRGEIPAGAPGKGGLTQTESKYNNANQITERKVVYKDGSSSVESYEYDKNGNNIKIETTDDAGKIVKSVTMSYDWLNRQTEWTETTFTNSAPKVGSSTPPLVSFPTSEPLEASSRYGVIPDSIRQGALVADPEGVIDGLLNASFTTTGKGSTGATVKEVKGREAKTVSQTQIYRGAGWKRIATVTDDGEKKTTVKYLYDGDNVVADYDGADKLVAEYVTPMLDQNLSMTRYDTDNTAVASTSKDEVLATSPQGEMSMATRHRHYYTQDGLGSVRTLTDTEGSVVENYDYLAFGEEVANRRQEAEDRRPQGAGTASAGRHAVNRYTYTGREQSSIASAPMYYRYRMYGSSIGRFSKRDPIGYAAGINVYGYVLNTPTNYLDFYGLSSNSVKGANGTWVINFDSPTAIVGHSSVQPTDIEFKPNTNSNIDGCCKEIKLKQFVREGRIKDNTFLYKTKYKNGNTWTPPSWRTTLNNESGFSVDHSTGVDVDGSSAYWKDVARQDINPATHGNSCDLPFKNATLTDCPGTTYTTEFYTCSDCVKEDGSKKSLGCVNWSVSKSSKGVISGSVGKASDNEPKAIEGAEEIFKKAYE